MHNLANFLNILQQNLCTFCVRTQRQGSQPLKLNVASLAIKCQEWSSIFYGKSKFLVHRKGKGFYPLL